jgi:hypothetical protein
MTKPKTMPQLLAQLVQLSKSAPGLPDDLTIANLLLEVITDEQGRLKDTSNAVLCGLAAAHLARFNKTLPTARHVNAKGEPVYTEEDVAKFTGRSVAQVRSQVDELFREGGADTDISRASAEELQPIH